jgi:hypothetical protein
MLTCKDASHLISENHERHLGLRERWSLRLHLWLCANCRRFERQITLLRQALRMLGERAEADAAREGDKIVGDNADFPPEVRERIRKVLAERGGHENGHEH